MTKLISTEFEKILDDIKVIALENQIYYPKKLMM